MFTRTNPVSIDKNVITVTVLLALNNQNNKYDLPEKAVYNYVNIFFDFFLNIREIS